MALPKSRRAGLVREGDRILAAPPTGDRPPVLLTGETDGIRTVEGKWQYISKDEDDFNPSFSKNKAGDYWVDTNLSRAVSIKRAHLFLEADTALKR